MAYRKKPRKKSKPLPLKQCLPEIFQSQGLGKEYAFWQIFSIWDKVVGRQIAQSAQPTKLYRQNLTVIVKNSAWMQELQFMKTEITDRLNREIQNREENSKEQLPLELPQIKNMKFLLGKLPKKSISDKYQILKESKPLSKPPPEVKNWVEEKTKKIKDSEWKKTLQNFLLQTQNKNGSTSQHPLRRTR